MSENEPETKGQADELLLWQELQGHIQIEGYQVQVKVGREFPRNKKLSRYGKGEMHS